MCYCISKDNLECKKFYIDSTYQLNLSFKTALSKLFDFCYNYLESHIKVRYDKRSNLVCPHQITKLTQFCASA